MTLKGIDPMEVPVVLYSLGRVSKVSFKTYVGRKINY